MTIEQALEKLVERFPGESVSVDVTVWSYKQMMLAGTERRRKVEFTVWTGSKNVKGPSLDVAMALALGEGGTVEEAEAFAGEAEAMAASDVTQDDLRVLAEDRADAQASGKGGQP